VSGDAEFDNRLPRGGGEVFGFGELDRDRWHK
jgi:hypothetical protein